MGQFEELDDLIMNQLGSVTRQSAENRGRKALGMFLVQKIGYQRNLEAVHTEESQKLLTAIVAQNTRLIEHLTTITHVVEAEPPRKDELTEADYQEDMRLQPGDTVHIEVNPEGIGLCATRKGVILESYCPRTIDNACKLLRKLAGQECETTSKPPSSVDSKD